MRTLVTVIFAGFAFVFVDAAELSKTMPIQDYKITTGLEPLPKSQAYPYNRDLITDSPGIELGWTYLDYQSNGSTGNRAAVCDDGSRYFCWMGILGWPYPPAPRGVFYYWLSPDGSEYNAGQIGSQGSAHPQLDIIYGDQGAIAFTQPETWVTLVIDSNPPGMGFFDYYDPPGQYWPHIAVDRNDNVHLLTYQFTDQYSLDLAYTRSTDSGNTWTELETIDSVMVIGGVIDASPVSDRVVIAYPKASDTTTQWWNDIVYVVSEDGITWDFENGQVNVTDYANDDDSLWAYTDLDVIIDYEDNIHIIWNAQWVTDEGFITGHSCFITMSRPNRLIP